MPDLAEVLAAHLAHLRLFGRSERTVYDRERAVIRLAAWLRPVPVLAATAADLGAWRASLTVGDQAVVVYCAHVAGFYDFAVTRGIIDSNPAAGLPVPSPPRGVPRPVSEEDLAAALACASGRVRPWLVLAGWAGMRAKEIALLKRDCVLDTAASPAILIARNATKGRRERLIPMSQFVLDELRLAGLPSHGYVFPRHDGRPGPNTPWLISQLAGRALHESGSSATLHSLRHRFARSRNLPGTRARRQRRCTPSSTRPAPRRRWRCCHSPGNCALCHDAVAWWHDTNRDRHQQQRRRERRPCLRALPAQLHHPANVPFCRARTGRARPCQAPRHAAPGMD